MTGEPPSGSEPPAGAPQPAVPAVVLERIAQNFFLLLLAGLTLVFLFVLRGFFQPIFWAAITGILFLPVQSRIEGRVVGRP